MNMISHIATSTRLLPLIAAAVISQFPGSVSGASAGNGALVSFVNAVPLETNTILSIDKGRLLKDGFAAGQATGGLSFEAGSHTIRVANGDCKPAFLNLQLEPNASATVIAYVVETDAPNGRITRKLRLLVRDNHPTATTKALSAIYAGRKPLMSVIINGQCQTLEPVHELRLASGKPIVQVTYGNQPIVDYDPQEAGSYLIILYDKPAAKIGGVVIRDVIRPVSG